MGYRLLESEIKNVVDVDIVDFSVEKKYSTKETDEQIIAYAEYYDKSSNTYWMESYLYEK